ncbi:MAG TPA: inositol monophosphatase family protein, partial [Thermomicrobiales bacterium]|nr:inositol monophosphatase family protein [Thermomicrobiales bacterium]
MTQIDVDAVSDMVREVATITIAPRFRQLATHDVEEKTPGEVVTVADREAEAMITTRLRGMLPGVPVVGEEAVALDATLLEAIRAQPMVWLVDP